MSHSITKSNAVAMFHKLIASNAADMFHKLTTLAKLNTAQNILVKNAAAMSLATIISMNVNQLANHNANHSASHMEMVIKV